MSVRRGGNFHVATVLSVIEAFFIYLFNIQLIFCFILHKAVFNFYIQLPG